MKSLAISLAVLSCLALSACAGTSGRNGIVKLDQGKILAVNAWAQQRGAHVTWVNYPTLAKRDSTEQR